MMTEDDRPTTVTELVDADKAEISEHLMRLGSQGRRSRFGFGVGEGFVKQYCDRILGLEGVIYGVHEGGELRAVAELREILDDWPNTAEAAFSVEPEFQGQGLGSALIDKVVADAKVRGTKTINMMCHRDNEPMKHLASKHDAEMEFSQHDVEMTIRLA